MTPLVYNLEVDSIPVHAVITWDGQRGRLMCSYEERVVCLPLSSQVQYIREDAMRALTSQRMLADMVGQLTYSRKATCRAISNRLDLLVEQGKVTEAEATDLLREVQTKWAHLQTEHDFDRFVSTNDLARRELARCKRQDEDFTRKIAPKLAEVIKVEVRAGTPAASTAEETKGRATERMLLGTLAALRGLLQRNGRPVPGAHPEEVLAGVGSLFDDLRAQADASLQAGALDAYLSRALEKRGIVTPGGFGPALKARAAIEYLGAVEAAAEKWQADAKRWQKFAQAATRDLTCARWRFLSHSLDGAPLGASVVEKGPVAPTVVHETADDFAAWCAAVAGECVEPGIGCLPVGENV